MMHWSFGRSSARCDLVFAERAAEVTCKVDKIRSAWAAGDRIGALRIAARFFDRSIATKMFKRGMVAHNHPDFYRQLGQAPEQIVTDALAVLQARLDFSPALLGVGVTI
jgi:hypothetical protein